MKQSKTMTNRLGETTVNNQGVEMFIIKYNNAKNIKVQFKGTNEVVKTTYGNFKSKLIKSRFSPSVFGFGIIGFEKSSDVNCKQHNSYICWGSMLERCYSIKGLDNHPSYKGCIVCEEWKYYKNFKEWYDRSYYEINNKSSQLDKDIIIKGNKIYSPKLAYLHHVR